MNSAGGEKTNEEPEEPFVRYWVHNGFVKVDSEKMSKSLGNFFTIREVTERYHPTALRWMLLGTHYRAPINYTQRALEEASDRLYYLYQTLVESKDALVDAQAKDAETAGETKPKPKPPTGIAAEGIELAAETTRRWIRRSRMTSTLRSRSRRSPRRSRRSTTWYPRRRARKRWVGPWRCTI